MGGHAAAGILVACAVIAWLLVANGLEDAPTAAIVSIAWLAAAALTWWWRAREARRLQAGIRLCDRLLDEFADVARET